MYVHQVAGGELRMAFGDVVRRLRVEQGLSQDALAARVDGEFPPDSEAAQD